MKTLSPWPRVLAILMLVTLIAACDNQVDSSDRAAKTLSYDQAVNDLSTLLAKVDWSEDLVQRRAKVSLGQIPDLKDTLPGIDEYPLTVDPRTSDRDVVVEVFVTTIRAWSPVVQGPTRTADGLMVEVAKKFNTFDKLLSTGRKAKVRVRYIPSGTAYQFIASGKYVPDAFSPVHQLWMQMLAAHGVAITPIRESTVESVGGIVMKDDIAKRLQESYGRLDVKAVINDVVEGNLAMGYTNPFASSTGLNFLTTILSTFADGHEEDDLFSPAVVDTFERFQEGVPFIALTTVQMRDAVQNDGSLDAFIMGHQTFMGSEELRTGYEFVPFGVKHDHPLFAVGDITPEKLEVLELFAKFAERPEFQEIARNYGWNQPIATDFSPAVLVPSGELLIRAQQLWKDKKSAGRPIAAVFLTDVSGSMAGTRLKEVKEALIAGSEFIAPENSIGLAVFSNTVRSVLPIRQFGLNQKAAFVAAVEDMDSGGGTAMYDGVVAALSMLLEEQRKNPDVKPILFVLSDGQTTEGLGFERTRNAIAGIKIPVYTIGYEADVAELRRLSSLVEAASMNAGEGDIQYKIGSLLNAQM